uniref:Calmodulin-binding domain-containing protein n=2 Tax=Plectus sambesii TaxID=2011161 RepID=A0A914VBW7_9BILA
MDNGGRRLAVLVGRRPRLCTKRPIMTDGRQRQQERLGSELAERRRRLCVVGRSSTIGQKTSPSSSPSSVGASLPPPPSLPPPIDGAMSSAPASPSYLRNAAATKNIHSGYDYSSISRAKVSSDILRVSGYSNQFRNLLTNKSSSARRESGPATFQKQHSDASYKSEPVGGGGGGGGADAEPGWVINDGTVYSYGNAGGVRRIVYVAIRPAKPPALTVRSRANGEHIDALKGGNEIAAVNGKSQRLSVNRARNSTPVAPAIGRISFPRDRSDSRRWSIMGERKKERETRTDRRCASVELSIATATNSFFCSPAPCHLTQSRSRARVQSAPLLSKCLRHTGWLISGQPRAATPCANCRTAPPGNWGDRSSSSSSLSSSLSNSLRDVCDPLPCGRLLAQSARQRSAKRTMCRNRLLATDCVRAARERRRCMTLLSSIASSYEKRNGGVSFALLEHRSGAHSRTGSVRVVHGAVHRRQSGYGIAISSDSTAKMRCRQRKLLFIKRNKICDLSLALAIVGIALTILDAELTALGGETGVDKQHPVSLLLRCLCVVSTLFLMVFLFVYHAIEVKIALIDSGADDWRVALTTERIIKLTLEIITCAICPLPGQCRFASYDGELAVEHYYLNSLWFVMVTFMSIGYGDIVPNTYCGRTLSIATGIVGAGVSSALIAVISRKLELSRAEKHVNNFMADSKLTNQRKNAAAAVLQQTWFIHKFKSAIRRGKSEDLRLRHHQRRFLQAINEFRRIKWDQRKLQEKGNSLLDVGKLHNEMHETLWEMHKTQDHLITQVDFLTQKIIALQNTLLSQQPEPRAMSSNALVPTAAVGTGAVPLPPQSALTSQLPPSNGLCQSTSANAIVHLPVPNSSSSSSTVVPMNLMDESMI